MTTNQRGFSLIELLVVTVIMGRVVASIYTLYLGTQKTAITSEEVVEVQQNLRFALDQLASDIRLAGFLVPSGTDPFVAAPATINATDLVMNTSMTTRRYARIESFSEADLTMTVASEEMVDLFEAGDTFYIIRPHTYEVLSGGKIDAGKDRANSLLVIRPFTVNEATAEGLTGPFTLTGIEYFPGDVIVPASTVQISYRLIDDPDGGDNVFILRRNGEDVAGKISDLRFSYLLENGNEVNSATAVQLPDIVAVRVRIEGQTDETMTGQENVSGIKTRALETVVRLRNQ